MATNSIERFFKIRGKIKNNYILSVIFILITHLLYYIDYNNFREDYYIALLIVCLIYLIVTILRNINYLKMHRDVVNTITEHNKSKKREKK